jgi:hypothetical protein
MATIFIIGMIAYGAIFAWMLMEQNEIAHLPREVKDRMGWGPINPEMICPHCQEQGTVRTKAASHKKGVHVGKVTAALLTGGVSLLATGLSRHEILTEAHCDNCQNSWMF